MINILTEQNVSRSLALLKPSDIYIKPDLEGITAGDFQKSAETADRGRAAAEAVSERLRALAVSADEYAAWTKKIAYVRQSPPPVDAVVIDGLKGVNPAAVERHLRVKRGDPIDDARINRDMLRIYGDGWYESVDYSLVNVRDRNILHVMPVEKSWGTDYLRFGVNLQSDFKEDSTFTLRAAYDKTWLKLARRRTAGRRRNRPHEPARHRSVPAARRPPALLRRKWFVLRQGNDGFLSGRPQTCGL